MNLTLRLSVNGEHREMTLDDPRVTLLDLLRERLQLTGALEVGEPVLALNNVPRGLASLPVRVS